VINSHIFAAHYFMALNSLFCADVPFRNYSLTLLQPSYGPKWKVLKWVSISTPSG